jgi:hypothetical protein
MVPTEGCFGTTVIVFDSLGPIGWVLDFPSSKFVAATPAARGGPLTHSGTEEQHGIRVLFAWFINKVHLAQAKKSATLINKTVLSLDSSVSI